MGVIVAGSSLGGVIYPIMLNHLQTMVGFAWAVRIAGFLTAFGLLLANLTIKTQLPKQQRHIKLSQLVDIYGFTDIRYCFTSLASFLCVIYQQFLNFLMSQQTLLSPKRYFYSLFIPYFYIEEYALFNGVSPTVASYLLAIINLCGIPARIIPGFLGDKFGV